MNRVYGRYPVYAFSKNGKAQYYTTTSGIKKFNKLVNQYFYKGCKKILELYTLCSEVSAEDRGGQFLSELAVVDPGALLFHADLCFCFRYAHVQQFSKTKTAGISEKVVEDNNYKYDDTSGHNLLRIM